MSRLFIQQEQRSDLSTPWPILAGGDDGRVISGRPDAWALLGFQRGMAQRVTLPFDAALTDPTRARGLFPVFSAAFEDRVFVVLEKVEVAELWPDNVYADHGLATKQ